jgi:prevent-host-death family protein
MRHVTIREIRALLPELEQALEREPEIIVTRRGKPIARLTSLPRERPRFDTSELRSGMKRVAVGSEVLIRQERDER